MKITLIVKVEKRADHCSFVALTNDSLRYFLAIKLGPQFMLVSIRRKIPLKNVASKRLVIMSRKDKMRIENLAYFIDVVDAKSIKMAADKNFISPQGLSHNISVLEKELNLELINRNANSIEVTRPGEMLYPYAKQIVSIYEDMKNEIDRASRQRSDPGLTILCSTFVFIGEMIDPLRRALDPIAPNTHYLQIPTEDIASYLIKEFDKNASDPNTRTIGIVMRTSETTDRYTQNLDKLATIGFVYKPYMQYHDCLLIARNHPIVAQLIDRKATQEDLRKIGVIASSAEQSLVLQRYIGRMGIRAYIEDLPSRAQLVKEGQGGILIPPFISLAENNNDYALIPLANPYVVEIGFVCHERFLASRTFFALTSGLNKYYEKLDKQQLLRLL